MDKVQSSEGFRYFKSYLLSSKDGHAMNSIPWSAQAAPGLLSNNLRLIPLIAGMLLLSVMLADGCVKRPTWEPTPGISPKVLMLWES